MVSKCLQAFAAKRQHVSRATCTAPMHCIKPCPCGLPGDSTGGRYSQLPQWREADARAVPHPQGLPSLPYNPLQLS